MLNKKGSGNTLHSNIFKLILEEVLLNPDTIILYILIYLN